ncbi:8813_t:CDS:2 [Diversispora eburnea]|uniref:8813_t:CDS:1 n=1 Tax=Diversispora eburnea TaxID=1213867 RepID=A0A9N9AFJ2_9GLOM|nr:8813_t:CDS:2 [Diversispora eburnea]
MTEKRKDKGIFPITPISKLKARPFPQTAACLIIGDEILNGKTFCFNLGIDVKRIEIIPDEEEAVKRLSSKFDFVVTSGGIGSTHDDITYPSIARAYNLSLKYHQPTLDRIENREFIKKYYKSEVIMSEATKEAYKRMALFPHPSLVVFPNERMWIPIVIVNENIHILPGIPKFFRGLLSEYGKYLQSGSNGREGEGEGVISERGNKFYRRFVKTYHPESYISFILAETQKEVKDLGIKIGSYPKWTENEKHVIVSFLSREVNSKLVDKIAKAVAEKIDGILIESNKL